MAGEGENEMKGATKTTVAKTTTGKTTTGKTTAAKTTTGKSAAATSRTAKPKAEAAFSAEEREAMKARAREMKAEKSGKADGEADVLARIATMTGSDREMAERIHAIVRATAPGLTPRTWYGMPAYARDGKVVCFFQDAAKFKARYATLGFNDPARLDEGNMWPTSFALIKLTKADEERIADLVRRAVG
jgi:uncharacterized protein YdhG (YjbR/CyaY superfamily)